MVLALPVNTLPGVGFEPALPGATAEALGSNAGRGRKVWLRARGVPAGVLAAGAGEGLHWLYADRALDDGDVLLIGFGYEDPAFDPGVARRRRARAARVLPGRRAGRIRPSRLERRPFSRGTWATAPVGQARVCSRPSASRRTGGSRSRPSDVAPREAGWIEGALLRGRGRGALGAGPDA